MNRLSIFYEHIFEAASQSGKTIEETLRYARSCGIDALECDYSRLTERESTKALFDRCGMTVSCIYRFFDMVNDTAELTAEKYRQLFDTAKFFGADKVLCVPGFINGDKETQFAKVTEQLRRMCAVAEEYGIAVTLEDFDDISSPCCRSDDILRLMEEVSGLRYTFDTGNFRYCLEDAAECCEKLRKYIVHVHCKDRSYTQNGGESKPDLSGELMYPAPVCEGEIGIEALVKRLCSDGYEGTFAIEHFGADDQLRYMKRSADNLLKAMKG